MTLLLHPKIEVRDSGIEGKGLFAKAPFIKGERFKAASGEHSWVTMTDAEFQAYITTVDSYDAVYLGNGRNRVSTVSREVDPSNYGNHGCDPNTASVADERVALRDIAAGEDLKAVKALLKRHPNFLLPGGGTSNGIFQRNGAIKLFLSNSSCNCCSGYKRAETCVERR